MFLIHFTMFLSTQQRPGNTSVRQETIATEDTEKIFSVIFWSRIDDFGISLKPKHAANRLRMPLLITSPPLTQTFQDL